MKRLIILIILIIFFISFLNLHANEKDYSTAGFAFYVAGASSQVIGLSMFIPSVFNGNNAVMYTGVAFFLLGTLSDAIIGPVLSLYSYNSLRQNNLIPDNLYLNSNFWYGMSWLFSLTYITGFIIMLIGGFGLHQAMLYIGIPLVILGLIGAVAFRGICVSIPLKFSY